MKPYPVILICICFLLPFTGCKKVSFDPAKQGREDFIGSWAGTISTFKDNQLMKENGTMVIYPDEAAGTVSGVIFMKETSVFNEFQILNGTLYFRVENPDPENPYCQNWTLSGFTVFTAENKIDLHITGNQCGAHGSEFIDWVGSMVRTQAPADSMKYFSFAGNGNSWMYNAMLVNGDSCEIQKTVGNVSGSYLFSGNTSMACDVTGRNLTFRWNVTPSSFSNINDSTLSNKPFTYPINAKPGVVYTTSLGSDTVTVTLLDTNLVATTPAGTFICVRFRLTEPVYSGITKATRTTDFWLNNRFGIIRQEVANPIEATDIVVQVLSSKTF